MQLVVVAIGKLRDEPAQEICARYVKRIGRFMSIEEIELKEDKQLVARMEKLVGPRDQAVLLDAAGETLDSQGFAGVLRNAELGGVQKLLFFIGGAYGFPAELSLPRARRVSFSRLTFPHQLMRPLLAEQLYRACTILKNVPYDH